MTTGVTADVIAGRRLRRGDRLVIATHNVGKLRELGAIFAPLGIETLSAATLGLPEPEETASDFSGNALLKAQAAAMRSGLPALADDSGFCVAALDGAPGVHSARWAGPEKNFARAMRRVLDQAAGYDDRAAWFVCALCLAWPDYGAKICSGRVDGRLSEMPRGKYGFGYDPIFVPAGDTRTYGEMTPAEKDVTSHRTRAIGCLLSATWDAD